MKRSPSVSLPRLAILVGSIAAVIAAPIAPATTLYWEPTGTTGANASGTWTTATTTLDWNTDSAGVATPLTFWTNGSDAIFSADPAATSLSTVTMGSAIAVNSLTFGNSGVVGDTSSSSGATGGYTFTNANTMTLGSVAGTGTALSMAPGVGAVTLSGPVTFGGSGSGSVNDAYAIVNNSSSLLTFGGTVGNNNASSLVLSVTGTGSGGVTFSGALVNNAGAANGNGRNTSLVINTTGAGASAVTTLSNTGNLLRGITVTSGILGVAANNVLGEDTSNNANSAPVSFGAAGQFNLSGTNQTMGSLSGVAGALIYNNSNTNSTLTIGNSNDGGLNYAGILEDNSNGGTTTGLLALTKTGSATITLSGANTYSGATSIAGGGGGITLNGAGALTNTASVTVGAAGQATSTLTYDNSATGTGTNARLNTAATVTLNGGTFTYKGVTATIGTNIAGSGSSGAIALGAGQTSFLSFTAASGTGNTSTFSIPSIAQGSNATLSAFLASVNTATDRVVVNASPTLINGIIPWGVETTNTNFLTTLATGGTGFYLGAYGNLTGTASTAFDNTATSNIKITAAQSALAANQSENSLVYAFAGTQGLGGHSLTLTSGGLILNNASAVLGSAANDGSITTDPANPTLYVYNSATGTINSAITDASGPVSVALTKFGASALTLAGTNTYTGATTVEQGALQITSGGSIAASSGTSVLLGATLTVNSGATAGAVTNTGTFTNSGTAGALTNNAGGAATLNGGSTTGAVTDNGALTIAGTTAVTTGNFSGTGGTGTITYTNALAAGGTLTFASGANSLNTISDNQTAGPLTIAVSGSGTLALATVTGSSGSTVKFGGGGTGSITIANRFAVTGQLIDVTSGTVTLANGDATAANIQVDGGSLIANNSRFSTSANNQTLLIRGGTLQVNSNSTYGMRLNGENGAGSGDVTGRTFTGTQTGGTVLVLQGGSDTGFSLGSSSGTDTSTYNLQGGLLAALSGTNNGYINLGADTSGTSNTTFNFSGGTILANSRVTGDQGTARQSFVWTGGTLTTALYDATKLTSSSGTVVSGTTNTLTNAGGTLAPGFLATTALTGTSYTPGTQYTGKTSITGNYSVTSSSAALAINIGGTAAAGGFGSSAASYDTVSVSGATTLGGKLNVSLINTYTPAK